MPNLLDGLFRSAVRSYLAQNVTDAKRRFFFIHSRENVGFN